MMRLRSSSRCSRKLIAGICSGTSSSELAVISGIRRLGERGGLGFEGGRLDMRLRPHRKRGNGAYRGLRWQDLLLGFGIPVELGDFAFYLGFKLIGSALEFVQGTANLPSNFRQFLGPKDQQGNQKQENHLREAQIHGLMITPESDTSKPSAFNILGLCCWINCEPPTIT